MYSVAAVQGEPATGRAVIHVTTKRTPQGSMVFWPSKTMPSQFRTINLACQTCLGKREELLGHRSGEYGVAKYTHYAHEISTEVTGRDGNPAIGAQRVSAPILRLTETQTSTTNQ